MTRPIVWTIAGTDPTGGAGVQADLAVFQGLGVRGGSVLTAILAQNSRGVLAMEYPSAEMIEAQLQALEEELPPVAIKLGMLGGANTVRAVAAALRRTEAFVVCDPVLRSSSGTDLLDEEGRNVLMRELLPRVDLLTPNIPEAALLLQRTLLSDDELEQAARDLKAKGPRAVLLKGGHRGSPWMQDCLIDEEGICWLTSPALPVAHTHGTGCMLSSALAAFLALGHPLREATLLAKAYLNQGLRLGEPSPTERGSPYPGGFPSDPADQPWVTRSAEEGRAHSTKPPHAT
jgi:hydroxymethylpyrimidine kinase/phosphomethylpyrimidine kinase